ncbi:cell wall-active antibiotics response protein LiaF [Bacillus sp. MUM 13]|uniref:cell wall-active antibiotics response protein LiaF n=1 Tax=Bacillus sp. MUM 13 TaxID=1678001 RepID=UPI0008F583DB|nr:cell wall-active antibiotics response protein LiaF [Bacillus sp. MUM 13]OIK09171.1 hypothetical protein BIV59_17665 [Bacillus sp. MUM 13]
MKKNSLTHILTALVLFAGGTVLLLINIGVISWEIKQIIVACYPYLLLIIGILVFLKSLKVPFGSAMFCGFFLMLLSCLLVADRLGFYPFHLYDAVELWPAIIIFAALRMLFLNKKIRVEIKNNRSKKSDNGLEKVEQIPEVRGFSIGSFEYSHSNWALEPMKMYKMIGDYHIDLSKAFISDRETTIELNGWIGDVEIIVPQNIPIRVKAKVNIGDVKVFSLSSSHAAGPVVSFESPEYDAATKKVNIQISLVIGDVRIDKV